MAGENHTDNARAVWKSQTADITHLAPAEIRSRFEQMEKKMRRSTYDLYAALTLSSLVIVGISALFPSPALTIGAALTLCGFGYLVYEVHQSRRAAPSADDGAVASVEYHRALLQHRRDFHRKRLWLRVFSLTPGGIIFFAGFAAAQPQLAPVIYFQLGTFIVAIILSIPLNRRAAIKLQREIDQLDRLQ